MEELSASQQAIRLNPQAPHLDNHTIVLELAGFEERFDAMDKYLIEQKQDKDALIDGLTKQVNYLQDKLKELEEECVRTADLKDSTEEVVQTIIPVEVPEAPVATEAQS